ncbi:MAG: hypothetical protein L0Y57_10665 [Beijerinckiaceae bacterium]|nr:hypothetical protein [Beijerinckiaceae bacterium]
MPDVPNNSIVVYATAEQFKIIERAINQLDRPRAQVAVDVTLAEVALTDRLRYGVQFFLGSIDLIGNQLGVQANNPFPTPPPGAQQSILGVPAPAAGEFNILLGNKLTPHVIISALHGYTTAKILANPSLVVIDNQVATFLVGDQIPVQTGSATFITGAATTSTIDYRNTGIILRVQPRINANNNILLDLEQEISACRNCLASGANLTPTISNRRVKSSIMVPAGQTVLLAGLIQETQSGRREGIPVLDQIPFLGEAFTPNNTRTLERTELIIFIRPQVIRDSVDASTVAEELRAKIRGDKTGTLNPPGNVTPYPLGLVQ